MSVKINEQDIWDICYFCAQHISRHAILMGTIAIFAPPSRAFLDDLFLATFVRTSQIKCLVIITQVRHIAASVESSCFRFVIQNVARDLFL
jgi:hypothetical protein